MADLISQGVAAVSTGSPYAAIPVFLTGIVSSVGPCVAPRFIAVTALTTGKSRAQTLVLALSFTAGLAATYAAFGAMSSLLIRAAGFSTYTYAAVAVALGAGGFITLWRGSRECPDAHHPRKATHAGAAMLLGASFGFVLSPCCTPIALAILAYAGAAGDAGYGSALMASFALGHALPLIALALGSGAFTRVFHRYAFRPAAGVVNGTLMLALAGYYGVLA